MARIMKLDEKQEKIYVKTVYSQEYMREPNSSEYDSTKDAKVFINACLKWGIGIVSCKIIPKSDIKI